MAVELLRTTEDGDQEVVATVRLHGGGIAVSASDQADADALLASWNATGVIGKSGMPVFPTTPDQFLAALPEQYNGSYLRARRVA